MVKQLKTDLDHKQDAFEGLIDSLHEFYESCLEEVMEAEDLNETYKIIEEQILELKSLRDHCKTIELMPE